ncbi:MAG TPA: SBBP repeat-containing protein, partial [Chitinophagaceae bacterium]|nr:SBBP repeat-containing protein [Chitinophagaceae bacterium]
MTLKPYLVIAMLIVTVQAVKAQDYGNIEFVENKGQWDSRVKYRGLVDAGAVFIRPQGFTILQHNKQDLKQLDDLLHPHSAETAAQSKTGNGITLRSHSWNVDFVGASPNMQVVPDKVISTYNNYFYGNDRSKWAAHCRIFQAVTLKDVYPNIDVRYYTNNGTLKYDILVKPGGRVSNIALRYEGLDKIQVKSKELVLSTTLGEMKESSPYTFQGAGKERKEVNCKYVVKDNIVRFDVKEYDPNSTLIIDPTLVFCSFSGSATDNWGFTATYGPDGAMYGGGIARNGNGFPVSPGAFQTNWGGGSSTGDGSGPNDIGIIKLTPDGSSRVYATYLGGTGNEQPHSLIVDPQGNLIVAGRTNSPNYPTTGTPGLIGTGGGYDIVLTKLNATGTALIGSKKIGGVGDDGVNINPTRG